MRITIILPAYALRPVGGFKVAYSYANWFVGKGHEVTVVHPASFDTVRARFDGIMNTGRSHLIRILRSFSEPWFRLDSRIRVLVVPDLRPSSIPEGDFVFATAWQTAEHVSSYPSAKGIRLYLVYDYEHWMSGDSLTRRRMRETYQAGFILIATSSAVRDLLTANGVASAATVFAGIDFSTFRVASPIEARPRHTVGFPVRVSRFKGTSDAIEAMRILKNEVGESLSVKAFGTESRHSLPSWIEYLRRPSDEDLSHFYNSCAIFVLPSHYEGWGLPGVEAMACGAALVTTDSGGVRDYAIEATTALVVPRGRPDLMALAVKRLLEDGVLRQRLAVSGHDYVQRYSWDAAGTGIQNLLQVGPANRQE